MPAHGSRRHDRSLVLSALFAVAAVAVAAVIITHQPGHPARMTDATGPAQLTATAAGCPGVAAATPCARPLATSYHQPAVAPRSPAARHAHQPTERHRLPHHIGPPRPPPRQGPRGRADREPGCGGPAGTGVD